MSPSSPLVLAVCAIALLIPRVAYAQNQNQNNFGGIRVDAAGVVTMALEQDRHGKLDQQRKASLAQKAVAGDVSRPSDRRSLSLVQLERACKDLLAAGKPLPIEIKCLAGLTRIDHVFVDRDQRDLVLSGPAEPFAQADSGRWLGLESGRPVLLLDHLVVALRSVNLHETVGCSIDPVAERLASLQTFLRQNSSPAPAGVVEQRYRRMREILGNHTVRIQGVPDDSRFARGLVEADVRMKLLALGLENPGVKGFRSHLSMVSSGNAIQRWWFVPLYDRIERSSDGLSYAFVGQRAQLLGEDELANAAGERSKAAVTKISTEEFSRQFTEKFPQLAAHMPVFAELQQLIDWTVFAALVRHERLAERIEWSMPVFADASKLPHESWPVPKETQCLVNTKRTKSGVMMGQLSGGVTIRPAEVLRQISVRVEDEPALAEQRTMALHRTSGREHAWWWDATD